MLWCTFYLDNLSDLPKSGKLLNKSNSRIAYTKSRTDITQMLVRVHDSSNHHIDSKSYPSNPARTTWSTGQVTWLQEVFSTCSICERRLGRGWFEMLTSSQPKCLDSTYRYPDSWWMLTTLKWSNQTPTTVADRNEFEVHMEPPCVCAVGLLPL